MNIVGLYFIYIGRRTFFNNSVTVSKEPFYANTNANHKKLSQKCTQLCFITCIWTKYKYTGALGAQSNYFDKHFDSILLFYP